jgi:hypothetical protein
MVEDTEEPHVLDLVPFLRSVHRFHLVEHRSIPSSIEDPAMVAGGLEVLRRLRREVNTVEEIMKQLEGAGYAYAKAFATDAEVEAQAACGQLGLIV